MKGPGRGVAGVGRDFLGGSLRRRQETSRRPDDETWPISRFGPNLRGAPSVRTWKRLRSHRFRGITLTLAIKDPFTARDKWKRSARQETAKLWSGHVRTTNQLMIHFKCTHSIGGRCQAKAVRGRRTGGGVPLGPKGRLKTPRTCVKRAWI